MTRHLKMHVYENGCVGYEQRHMTLSANQRVCKECAVKIVKGLDAVGLIGVPREDLDKFGLED